VVRSLGLLVAFVVLLGCATPPSTTGAATSPAADTPTAAPSTEPTATRAPITRLPLSPTTAATPDSGAAVNIPAQATTAVDQARQAVATKTGVSLASVTVASVEAVSWPTSALGCPQPGVMYSQLVTPGFKVVVSANGQSYEYHADLGGHVVTCSAP
jgi:hypothetical protein